MKKFILKALFFTLIIVAFSCAINFSTPFYWANKGVDQKLKYLKTQQEKFNTLFLGSSRTQMHISPSDFDNEMKGETNSFNLGYSSSRAEELIFLIEELIEKEPEIIDSLKFLFLEIRPIFYDPENLFTPRGKYSLNKANLDFLTNFYAKTKYGFASKDIRKAYIESSLGIGLIRDKISYLFSSFFTEEDNLIGDNGFLNRRKAIKEDAINKLLNSKKVVDPQKVLNELQERISFANQCFDNIHKKLENKETIYLNKLNSLNEKLIKKGIKLVLFPSLRFQNTNIISLINKGNSIKLLSTAHPKKHPEFFNLKFSGDAAHLNHKGAIHYTRALAREFKKSLTDK